MSLQIIILKTNTQPDSSFSVSGVFWLTAPINNIIPIPDFTSQVPFIDQNNLITLRSGVLVEQSFTSGLFSSNTIITDVQASIQSQYISAQTILNASSSPINGLVGTVFDGSSWKNTTINLKESSQKLNLSGNVVILHWSDFKEIIISKILDIQYVNGIDSYHLFAIDAQITYSCTLIKKDYSLNFLFSSDYTQAQNDTDVDDFENNYKQNCNKQIDKKDVEGRPIHIQDYRTGDEQIFVSCNFADPATWYDGSIRVTEEILIDSGDGYRFNNTNVNWIDIYSGRIYDDYVVSATQKAKYPKDPHGYEIIITVDGYAKSCCPIFSREGGDYWVNYDDGYVIFLESQTGKEVKASYSYANECKYIVDPPAGKKIIIESAKADFSYDVVMNDSVHYAVYGYVDVFAPELMPGVPSGTQIELSNWVYKRYHELFRESNSTMSSVPAVCSTDIDKLLPYNQFRQVSRGSKQTYTSVAFRYGTVRELSSKYGMKLVLYLENNKKFDGALSGLTLFGIQKDEV